MDEGENSSGASPPSNDGFLRFVTFAPDLRPVDPDIFGESLAIPVPPVSVNFETSVEFMEHMWEKVVTNRSERRSRITSWGLKIPNSPGRWKNEQLGAKGRESLGRQVARR